MPHSAKIIADSVSPAGHRLTTFEVCLPRIVLAEFNTHRLFSRNSASSRAIPVEKMLKMALEEPYIPTHWGKNQKGMQAEVELSDREKQEAKNEWLLGRNRALTTAEALLAVGLHKQITNRVLEPWLWHTIVVSSTEWDNWDHLRDHPAAHPDIQVPAHSMRELRVAAKPARLGADDWHLPYVTEEDRWEVDHGQEPFGKWTGVEGYTGWTGMEVLKRASVGRCAAVSYMRQNLQDMIKDTERCGNMLVGGHMSPFEHVARPMTETELATYRMNHYVFTDGTTADSRGEFLFEPGHAVMHNNELRVVKSAWTDYFCGNFNGWIQYRKEIPYESDILSPLK